MLSHRAAGKPRGRCPESRSQLATHAGRSGKKRRGCSRAGGDCAGRRGSWDFDAGGLQCRTRARAPVNTGCIDAGQDCRQGQELFGSEHRAEVGRIKRMRDRPAGSSILEWKRNVREGMSTDTAALGDE